MMIHAIGQYTPNQTKSFMSKNHSLQTGKLTPTYTQTTPQFGGDFSDVTNAVLKVLIPVGIVGALGVIGTAVGIGYWMGKNNAPQAPVQPAPTVQTDNTNPPTK